MTTDRNLRRASSRRVLGAAVLACAWATCASPLAAQTTLTLAPIKDTYVQDTAPTSNFGSQQELWFGRGSFFGLGLIRTLVEFDLTQLPHANVKQATFSAWQFNTEDAAGGIDCSVRRCTEPWDELTATWSMQPAYDSKSWAVASVGDSFDPPKWIDWDVTDLVHAQAAGEYPSFGWLFRVPFETSGISRLGYFHSREYFFEPDKRPKLDVELYDLDLTVAQPLPGVPTPITVERAEPNHAVVLAIDLTKLGLTPIPRLGVVLELHDPAPLATLFADSTGTAQASLMLPATSGVPFWIQAASVGKLSNVVALVAP